MKRKARQIMSLLLALAMIFSVFAGTGITAFAQEQAYLTLSTEQTEYGIGEYFYMTLSGFNIENVETADIQITFDSDCIDCCYIEANPSAGFTFGNGGFVSIDTLTWSFAYDEQTEKNRDLIDIEFKAIKSGTTSISVQVLSWSGSESVPADITYELTISACTHSGITASGGEDPTCTEPGYAVKYYCSDCGEFIGGGEEIPSYGGHIDTDGDLRCDRCDFMTEASIYDEKLYYQVKNNEVIIWGCDPLLNDSIDVPETIEGYPVTTVAEAAFGYGKQYYSGKSYSVACVTLPESVTVIKAAAFMDFSNNNLLKILNPECEIYDSEETIGEGTIIYGYAGSTAQAYAKKYSRTFVTLDVYDNLEAVKQQEVSINIPENKIKELSLPFNWADVLCYTCDGKYAMFLTVDSYTEKEAVRREEAVTAHVINYKLYYTEDFKEFKTAEYSIDTSIYTDYYASWPFYEFSDWFLSEYGYEITATNNDGMYYINTSVSGEYNNYFSVGVIFDNGETSIMDTEIAKSELYVFDNYYIMADGDTVGEKVRYETVTVDGEEYYLNYYAPCYYYSEDFRTWTKMYGPEVTKMIEVEKDDSYVASGPSYAETYGYFYIDRTLNTVSYIHRPTMGGMATSASSYSPTFVTINGKDFIELKKTSYSSMTSWAAELNGSIIAMNRVYGYYGKYINTQIVKYDNDGNATVILEYVDYRYVYTTLTTESEHAGLDIAFSINDGDGEFAYTDIYTIDTLLNCTLYKSDLDSSCIATWATMEDAQIIIQTYNGDTLLIKIVSDKTNETVYTASLPFTIAEADERDGNFYIFGDTSYVISERTIMNAIFPDASADSDEIIISDGSDITADIENGQLTVTDKSTISDVLSQIENENVTITKADGTELKDTDYIGTGCKIQLTDSDGGIISEYDVIVPTDVDGNGKTTAADARLALRASARLETIEGVYAIAADCDKDSKLTAADARKILRKSAGLE